MARTRGRKARGKSEPIKRDLRKYLFTALALIILVVIIAVLISRVPVPGSQRLPDEYFREAEKLARQGLTVCVERLEEGERPRVVKKVADGAGFDAMAFPSGPGKYTASSNGFYKGALKTFQADLLEDSRGYFTLSNVREVQGR